MQRLLAQGTIGSLSYVRAALSITAPPGDIRLSPGLGGGALLDLGCYCVSAARLFAGEPERVYAEAVLSGDGVDLGLAAMMRLPGGVLAQFDVGLQLPRRDELELVGIEGKILIDDPWLCRSRTVKVWRDGRSEQVPIDPDDQVGSGQEADVYRIEFDAISHAIATGSSPAFGPADAVAQARALEAVRESSERAAPVSLPHPLSPSSPMPS